MNSKKPSSQSTISYYESNSDNLIAVYESAEMDNLHTFLLSNLQPNSKVLDIGFGSGRDLSFLQAHGFDIWGIDPSQKFVDHAKKRFSDISDHFFNTSLPNLNVPQELLHSFDNITLIAVWMHLPKAVQAEAIKSLCSLLKPKGRIILSYSVTARAEETERYFEDIDSNILQTLFKGHRCKQVSKISNKDGLGEREITWVTEAYTYDKL